MRDFRFLPVLIFAMLCAMTGCDSSRKQIVGKWKASSQSSDVVWEFFDNGTLSTDGNPGRYTFGDNQRIKIQTQTATFVHQLELNGDRMTWTDPRGTKTEFTRVK
jgi:hypothetical protein